MFKRQREFNIISGEVAHDFITQRSRSCVTQLESYNKIKLQNIQLNKLGTPKDKHQFQYSYIQNTMPLINSKLSKQPTLKKTFSSANHTMMNYVSTNYNIINHSNQIETAKVANKQTFQQKMPEVYKKSPLTQHFHRARLLAPNYHQNYQARTNNRQFLRKAGYCSDICDIQKTYGQSKYFRKLK